MKNFFKFTKSKLILAIVLFLLLPVWYSIIVLGGPAECNGAMTCRIGTDTAWLPFGGGIFLIVSLFVGGNQIFETGIDYLLKTPYLLLVAYLLACLIIHPLRKK